MDPIGSVNELITRADALLNTISASNRELGTPKDSPALRRKLAADHSTVNRLLTECQSTLASIRGSFISKPIEERREYERLTRTVQEMTQRVVELAAAPSRKALPPADDGAPAGEQSTSHIQHTYQLRRVLDTAAVETELEVQQEKNAAIAAVAQDIAAMRELFDDARDLIHEQRADVTAVSTNVARAERSVDTGVDNIVAARHYHAKSRKSLGVLAIVIVVVILLIIVGLGGAKLFLL